ncbi:MAG: cell division protein FtsZ [Candidatus Muiribacterium halophilum]|uniref:Cell division protein FtsZ n=1 Tax=Muiribacterium halophilum TaxID=2053465 RepID=A0A2N5ZMZ0_MUIH1|nr:MAG: cell division protein FtsZ [Candidatus Muirbacterium halophilum]
MIEHIDFLHGADVSIAVAGLGGGGSNVVDALEGKGLSGVKTMVFNTDSQALLKTKTKNRYQVGDKLTKGLGAGANPEVGYESMKRDIDSHAHLLEDVDMIFVVACLGGGTGSGSSIPFIEKCRKLGILTVAVVTLPFTFEGKRRKQIADQALNFIKERADTTVVLKNDNLMSTMKRDTSLKAAFAEVDHFLSDNVSAVIDLIREPGVINLDFADITAILRDSNLAFMGTAYSDGKNRARKAVVEVIESPLIQRDISNASGVLMNITGPEDMKLFELNEISQYIQEKVDPDANIIIGTTTDNSIKVIKVMLLVSGFDE